MKVIKRDGREAGFAQTDVVTMDTCFYTHKRHSKDSGFEAGDAVFFVEKFHAELVGKEIKETGTDHREQDRDG